MLFNTKGLTDAGLVFAIVVMTLLSACGTSDSGEGATNPRSTKIIVADRFNNRVVQMSDMYGANWTSVGNHGSGVSQFDAPQRVAFDSLRRISVADTGNNRIVRMNDISGTGWVTFGTYGTGVAEFAYPNAIAVDAQFRIYVLDYNNNRVIRVDDMTGNGWAALGAWDCGGQCFGVPESLALDIQGRIFVGEGSQVIRFDGITGPGRTVLESYDGNDPDTLTSPAGLAIDSLGRIYVAAETKLVRFDDITGSGRVTFRADGSGQGGFLLLMGVAVDSNGQIYMVESSHERVSRIADMSGNHWIALGSYGNGALQFTGPHGIAVH